jgi:DNA-directed RNA polymerase specialized sigma24 family protein
VTEEPELDLQVIRKALADPHGEEFALFFIRYGPAMQWAVGLWALRWPTLAPSFDDILQEVWEWVLKDARRHPLLGSWYLTRITRRWAWRICKRHLRHPTEELGDEPDDDWDFTVVFMHLDERQRLVPLMREALSEEEAWFFDEHFVKGRPIKDVGADRGKRENASHQFKRRLQRKLVALAKTMLGPNVLHTTHAQPTRPAGLGE